MPARPTIPDLPALDDGDVDPDLLVGEPVAAEHDLDVDGFDEDQVDEDLDADSETDR